MILFFILAPGLFIFSYWHLGFFNSIESHNEKRARIHALVKPHTGDYVKSGGAVMDMIAIYQKAGLRCDPIIIYHDDPQTTIKGMLKSEGGCIVHDNQIPAAFKNAHPKFADEKIRLVQLDTEPARKLSIKGHPALALRKILAHVNELQTNEKIHGFPIIQTIGAGGRLDYWIHP